MASNTAYLANDEVDDTNLGPGPTAFILLAFLVFKTWDGITWPRRRFKSR